MYHATYNFNANGVSILQASAQTPTAIQIQYMYPLNHAQRKEVERVVGYWLGATAILDRNAPAMTAWTGENTLHVFAPFQTGAFKGDLMHRDSIGSGDGKFDIGLAKLFSEGYTTISGRGHGCKPGPLPNAISFVYGINTQPARLEGITWRNYENAPVMHMQLLTTGVLR